MRARFFRHSELVLIGYFLYTAALAQFLPISGAIARVTRLLNACIVFGFVLLAYADSLRRREFLGIVRDWYPMPLSLLAYREMGWFALPIADHRLERAWVVWDRFILNDCGLKAAIEFFGPVLPGLLEIAYVLVYTTSTFSMAMLYAYHRRERVDSLLTQFLLGILIAYALFPYFPSEPPRTVFPGQDFPNVVTVFRKFNWWLLGGYGIHTSVFPSAHVSGAFSAAFAMMRVLPERRWVGRSLLVLAVLIATATVYGRYRYSADAAAGFAIAALVHLAMRRERFARK